MRFAVFAKHLQAWPLEECARRVKAAGFDGLDLTVRPGGYVEPGEHFERNLAAAVKLVRSHGLEVPLFTTGLLSADDPAAEPTMRLAASLGVRELKLHYWPWEPTTPLSTAVDRARRALGGLASLAAKHRARINVHNHSGDWLQNSPWVIADLLREHDPAVVGAYIDPAHFTIEGGLAGWRAAIELLGSRAALLAIKDSKWIDVPGIAQPSQERRWVPVGSGNVRWPQVLGAVKAAGFDGWASIHGEYQGRWSWKELSAAEVLDQCVRDRDHVRSIRSAA